jgi:hypothetical protein
VDVAPLCDCFRLAGVGSSWGGQWSVVSGHGMIERWETRKESQSGHKKLSQQALISPWKQKKSSQQQPETRRRHRVRVRVRVGPRLRLPLPLRLRHGIELSIIIGTLSSIVQPFSWYIWSNCPRFAHTPLRCKSQQRISFPVSFRRGLFFLLLPRLLIPDHTIEPFCSIQEHN